jgi:hypothetical protein
MIQACHEGWIDATKSSMTTEQRDEKRTKRRRMMAQSNLN